MHLSRLVAFFLGIWIAGSIAIFFIATQNFSSVDRMLQTPAPQAGQIVSHMEAGTARQLLRYQASEENRWFFENWERVQFAVGAILIFLVLMSNIGRRFVIPLILAMLALVAVQHWIVTPDLVELGRKIDFIPDRIPSVDRTRFWNFHSAYSAMEVVKFGLGIIVLGKVTMKSSQRRSRKRDRVDDSDDGHVDR